MDFKVKDLEFNETCDKTTNSTEVTTWGTPVSCSNIERLCYYYLVCIQRWETTKYKFTAMRKPCAAIPAYTSKLMHCAATDMWKYCLRRSSLVTCGKTCENMCRSFIMLWYDRMKETKGLLLKTYLENHKPRQYFTLPRLFHVESMKGGVDCRNTRWIPWNGGWNPYFWWMDSMEW